MTETTAIAIRDKVFTIKRFSFDEGVLVDEFIETHKNDVKAQQKFIVKVGTLTPPFTDESIGQEDHETIARLWYEIQTFNRFDTNFLSLLRNLSTPGAQLDATRQS